MNLCDAQIVIIFDQPYERYGKWWLDVGYTSWSSKIDYTSLMFNTEEEAKAVKIRDMILV